MVTKANPPQGDLPPDDETPRFNSRIARTYIDYMDKFHPEVDILRFMNSAGITFDQVHDSSHWYSQKDVNRFNAALTEQLPDDPEFYRKVGRWASHSRATGPLRQFILGFLSFPSVMMRMDRLYSMLVRGTVAKTRQLGPSTIEIKVIPGKGDPERPFQCQNRIGNFEATGEIFLGRYPEIEHPECMHRGDPHCRYEVSWISSRARIWHRVRNIVTLLCILVTLLSLFLLPSAIGWGVAIFSALLASGLTHQYLYFANQELKRGTSSQAAAAKELIEETQLKHKNGLMMQRVAQVTARKLSLDPMLEAVVEIVTQRFEQERVEISLINAEDEPLTYYQRDSSRASLPSELWVEEVLRTRQPLVLKNLKASTASLQRRAGSEGDPVGDVNTMDRIRRAALTAGLDSLICEPIIYEDRVLGALSVWSTLQRRGFVDHNLLSIKGVAAQTAVGIHNCRSIAELKDSERQYRDLVESADIAILRFTPIGELTFANLFAQALFNLAPQGLLGKNISGTIFPGGHQREAQLELLLAPLREHPGRLHVLETHPEATIKTDKWIVWTFKAITGEGGALSEVLAIGSDISELKAADNERQKLSLQLMQAQKMEAIGTLAGGIAHDFNNLLMVIEGNTSLLLDEPRVPHEAREMLEEIKTSTRNAAGLTRQMLGFARGGKYEPKPTDINALVEETVRLFGRSRKEIKILTRLAEGIWTIRADQGQIEQTLLNMFLNASQAMSDHGELSIRTENLTLAQGHKLSLAVDPGVYVKIDISDDGIGMDSATQARIFEPFFSTKNRERGTGLGLASSYGIIKNHGGSILVESSPGQGSTFSILLPAAPEARVSVAEQEHEARRGEETVLVVDDEQRILGVSSKILRSLGYNTLVASSGQEAVETYRAQVNKVDLVLLDMIMPGMNGVETFHRLQEINPSVKVLLSSGYSLGDQARELIQHGACGFLQKPFSIPLLSEKITRALQLGSPGREDEPSGGGATIHLEP